MSNASWVMGLPPVNRQTPVKRLPYLPATWFTVCRNNISGQFNSIDGRYKHVHKLFTRIFYLPVTPLYGLCADGLDRKYVVMRYLV